MDVPSVQEMLTNLDQSLPYVQDMVFAVAYVGGMLFIFRALYSLKVYGEMRTMMATQSHLWTPISLFIAGAFLLYLPTAIHYTQQTVFDKSGNILAYSSVGGGSWRAGMQVVMDIVRVVGLIAFVRGWFILGSSGQQGMQGNTVGKALTHVLGGILAFNISETTQIVANTFGF